MQRAASRENGPSYPHMPSWGQGQRGEPPFSRPALSARSRRREWHSARRRGGGWQRRQAAAQRERQDGSMEGRPASTLVLSGRTRYCLPRKACSPVAQPSSSPVSDIPPYDIREAEAHGARPRPALQVTDNGANLQRRSRRQQSAWHEGRTRFDTWALRACQTRRAARLEYGQRPARRQVRSISRGQARNKCEGVMLATGGGAKPSDKLWLAL